MIYLRIDADELAFLSAYRCKTKGELHPTIDGLIAKYMEALDGEDYKVYLSCRRDESYRRRLFPAYKAHRSKREPPELLGEARAYLLKEHGAILYPALEADDLLGIVGTIEDGNINIVVTQDKDALTVPCMLYNHRTKELKELTHDEALVNLAQQVLIGDSCDGFKGCKGIGKVKAARIVGKKPHRCWQKVLRAYLKAGQTRADMEMNYMLAKILRSEPMKQCTKCGEMLELPRFHKDKTAKDGLRGECKECKAKYNATYNSYHGEDIKARHRAYHASRKVLPTVLLTVVFNHMQQAVRGQNKARPNMQGRDICTREEFLMWALHDPSFVSLYTEWQEAGCPTRTLTPSIDRISNDGGYELTNIQWLTTTDNIMKQ